MTQEIPLDGRRRGHPVERAKTEVRRSLRAGAMAGFLLLSSFALGGNYTLEFSSLAQGGATGQSTSYETQTLILILGGAASGESEHYSVTPTLDLPVPTAGVSAWVLY